MSATMDCTVQFGLDLSANKKKKRFGSPGSPSYIHIIEIKVMRYIVKASLGKEIFNIYSTNDYSRALCVERKAKESYESVWICDCIMEVLVG